MGVALLGSMMFRAGLPSSSEVTHALWVAGSMRNPSVWPGTVQVFTTLPSSEYSTMVLVLPSLPSLAVTFWYPTQMLLPSFSIESGFEYLPPPTAHSEMVHPVGASR